MSVCLSFVALNQTHDSDAEMRGAHISAVHLLNGTNVWVENGIFTTPMLDISMCKTPTNPLGPFVNKIKSV